MSRGFKRTTKLLTKVLLRDGKKERERESGTSSSSSSSQDVCERRTARCGKRKKRRRYTGDLLILVFLNLTRFFSPATLYPSRPFDDDLFFRSTRHIPRAFYFFLVFGRSVDKTTTTTTTTTTHPSGGVRREPLRSIASSSSSSSSSSSRERERERENPQTTLFGMYQR